jgi:hypothetical protein
MTALRAHEAQALIRARQEGYGNPIISVTHRGHRLVAVKNKLYSSTAWVFFTDFLIDFLKEAMGRAWGARAQAEGVPHPIFRWLDLLRRKDGLNGARTEDGVPERGYVSSLFRLAYALYLIAHHDEIAPGLVKRLRSPRDDIFRPAMYEALVAAAFAVAGFSITGAEHRRTSEKTPEFWATAKSGVRYSVEAKCKLKWKAGCDPFAADFRDELRAWLRDKIYASSRKLLANPVYWFELSIATELSEAALREVGKITSAVLEEAADMTIDGEPAAPAYVFITNNNHLVSDYVAGAPFMAIFTGFRMDDFRTERHVSLEAALEIRDRHREIARVFECLQEVQRVPMSFDGAPAELLQANGEPLSTVRVGHAINLEFPDGTSLSGTLSDITIANDVAWVVITDPQGVGRIATMPLTDRELAAAKRLGLAIFGKPEGPSRDLGGDLTKLYDWLLDCYASYDTEQLCRQIAHHHALETIRQLPLPELRKRVAREVAKGVFQNSGQRRAA